MRGLVDIVTGVSANHCLEVVATSRAGSGSTVWHASESSPGSNSWTGWQPLGAPGHGDPGVPALVQRTFDGLLEVFVTTAGDRGVWHAWQTPPPVAAESADPRDDLLVPGWSDWAPLGPPGGEIGLSVALTQLLPAAPVMALVAAGGKVWHARERQQPGPGPDWSEWSSLDKPGGHAAMAVAMASNIEGRVEVVALAESAATGFAPTGGVGRLWHRTLTPPDNWSDWAPLGPPGQRATEPVVVQKDDGDVFVFTIVDGTVWHRRLHASGPPGPAEGWARTGENGQVFQQVTAFPRNALGRMVLAATTHGNDLWNTTETPGGTGTWAPWTPLATVPAASQSAESGTLGCPRLGIGPSMRLHLFVVGHKTKGLYQVTAATAEDWQPAKLRPWSHPNDVKFSLATERADPGHLCRGASPPGSAKQETTG